MTLIELRSQYEEKMGKPISNRYKNDADFMFDAINKANTPKVAQSEQPLPERFKETKNVELLTLPKDLVPAFLNGEPFAIIDNKYIPWEEGQIMAQENLILVEQAKLEKMRSGNYVF